MRYLAKDRVALYRNRGNRSVGERLLSYVRVVFGSSASSRYGRSRAGSLAVNISTRISRRSLMVSACEVMNCPHAVDFPNRALRKPVQV